MAQTRKSIIEEAFMEAENIEKAFTANSKEILTHTMGSEIEEMIKESLKDLNGMNEVEDDGDVELELDLDSEDEAGLDAGDDLDLELDDMDMDDMDMDDDSEVVDLTGEDDMTIISVFKKMADDDEIEVIQTETGVDIKDNETGAEYTVVLGDSEEDMDMEDMDSEIEYEIELDDEDMDMEDMDMEDMDMEDMDSEIEYQIELDDEEGDEEDDEEDDEVLEDSRRTPSNMRKHNLKPSNLRREGRNFKPSPINESNTQKYLEMYKENKVLKNKLNSIENENQTLKEDYNKMVDALKEFRQKLNEVAVFNSNLTYTVRLFTEHSTTKEEKINIIKRFDEAKDLKESKTIYKNLVKEISNTKTPIKESIDKKLNEIKNSSSSVEITESKVYLDPQLEKMKKLWEYDYKK